MTETLHFQPDWVSPPGGTIEDLLEERGWTRRELARRLGATAETVNDLVAGRVPITANLAERLAGVLGSSIEFWLAREAQYRAALKCRAVEDQAALEVPATS